MRIYYSTILSQVSTIWLMLYLTSIHSRSFRGGSKFSPTIIKDNGGISQKDFSKCDIQTYI